MMIVLLLFLQKQNLAFAVYQFGSVLSFSVLQNLSRISITLSLLCLILVLH
jgi:hypothetical protein